MDNDSDGLAVGDERNADRGAFPEQVRATQVRAAPGMGVDASAAKGPTLLGRKDLVGADRCPIRRPTRARVRGSAEQGDAAGGAGKQPAQALRDEAKDLFARGAGLEQTAEFADLSDFVSLAAGIVEQAADFLMDAVSCVCAALRWAISCCWWNWVRASRKVKAISDAAIATLARVSPCACFQRSISKFVHDKHGDQDQIGAEEAEEIRWLRRGCGSGTGPR